MDRIKIKGLSSLELIGAIPEKEKEYLVSIVAERDATRIDEKDPETPITIYEMSYLRTEAVQEIGSSNKLKISNGKTPSQKLRFVLRDLAALNGKDEDEFYQEEMTKIITHYSDKLK